MGEQTLPEIAAALALNGHAAESQRVTQVLSDLHGAFQGSPYPYGSEYSYDNTGEEAVYTAAKASGDTAILGKVNAKTHPACDVERQPDAYRDRYRSLWLTRDDDPRGLHPHRRKAAGLLAGPGLDAALDLARINADLKLETSYSYNDLFPLFVAQRFGPHFFAAVWEQAKTTEQILQTMTRLTDQSRVQCMVEEYAARLALGDFQELSTSIQGRASAAMYEATTDTGGVLRPSNASHLPRYTGRNDIAIAVTPGALEVGVTFLPDAARSKGTPSDMRAQVVYRATDGSAVFSPPVPSGATTVTLTKSPKNGVVVVVVSNVTMGGYKNGGSYGWDPNETFGYGIKVTGGTPAPTGRLYF